MTVAPDDTTPPRRGRCASRGRRTALCGLLCLALASAGLPRTAAASDTSAAALTVSNRALQAYRAGRYKQAAVLYRAAYHTHPSELTYLYNAARAAQLAGLLKDSERDYVAYLMKAEPGSPAVSKARVHLTEIRAALRAKRSADANAAAAPRVAPPTAPSTVGQGQRIGGWIVLGAGVIVGVASGVTLARAVADQNTLDAKLAQKEGDKIVGISKEDADLENSRITNSIYLGWGLAGAGVLGIGVGAVLVATAPRAAQRVSLLPWVGGRGLSATLRF